MKPHEQIENAVLGETLAVSSSIEEKMHPKLKELKTNDTNYLDFKKICTKLKSYENYEGYKKERKNLNFIEYTTELGLNNTSYHSLASKVITTIEDDNSIKKILDIEKFIEDNFAIFFAIPRPGTITGLLQKIIMPQFDYLFSVLTKSFIALICNTTIGNLEPLYRKDHEKVLQDKEEASVNSDDFLDFLKVVEYLETFDNYAQYINSSYPFANLDLKHQEFSQAGIKILNAISGPVSFEAIARIGDVVEYIKSDFFSPTFQTKGKLAKELINIDLGGYLGALLSVKFIAKITNLNQVKIAKMLNDKDYISAKYKFLRIDQSIIENDTLLQFIKSLPKRDRNKYNKPETLNKSTALDFHSIEPTANHKDSSQMLKSLVICEPFSFDNKEEKNDELLPLIIPENKKPFEYSNFATFFNNINQDNTTLNRTKNRTKKKNKKIHDDLDFFFSDVSSNLSDSDSLKLSDSERSNYDKSFLGRYISSKAFDSGLGKRRQQEFYPMNELKNQGDQENFDSGPSKRK